MRAFSAVFNRISLGASTWASAAAVAADVVRGRIPEAAEGAVKASAESRHDSPATVSCVVIFIVYISPLGDADCSVQCCEYKKFNSRILFPRAQRGGAFAVRSGFLRVVYASQESFPMASWTQRLPCESWRTQ